MERFRVWLSFLLVFLAGSLPSAQDRTFSAEVKVVNVLATVRNNKGEVVRNLTKDDFILEEEGLPHSIRYFSQESDLPLTLGMLVDTSGSQRRVLGQQRVASYRFFDQVLREDKDQAFLIHFDFDVELLQDLTSSRKELEVALARLEVPDPRRPFGQRGGGGWPQPRAPRGGPGGGTALYDSVLLASEELMARQRGRKALIVLSDGVDAGSKVPLTEAIEAAQRADTLVYSIRFFDEDAYPSGVFGGRRRGAPRRIERPDGKKVLQQISKATGGGYFEVSKKLSIEQIYKQVEEELRNQYSLGFSPQQGGRAGYRKLHLTTKQRGLVVQARDGYYAEP